MLSPDSFKALAFQLMGPTAFWLYETRVRERQTVLNWGCVHPMTSQAVLFGITCAEFGGKESVFDLAMVQMGRQLRGKAQ